MSFLSGWWALTGLLAGPVILLYMLKMRRRTVDVSSTLLWRQVLADMRANTPFQKLRRNLLLLLQLIILSMLVASLCRPVIRAVGGGGSDVVVIVDASASMQATDDADGKSRYELAVAKAEELIDSLRRSDRMMLIIAGPPGFGARTPFTDSKAELRRVLRSQGCYDTPTAVSEALRLAASSLSAKGGTTLRGKVYLFSDGVGVTLPEVPGLTGAIEYVRMGRVGVNAGITSLSVGVGRDGKREVSVGVGNFGPEATLVEVGFFYGSESNWIDTLDLQVPAGGKGSVVLSKSLPSGRLWVRLECEEDFLSLDDRGYSLLPKARKMKVRLVTAGNPILKKYLSAGEKAGLFEAETFSQSGYVDDGGADVTIFDQVVPGGGQMPAGDVVLINPSGRAGGFRRVGELPSRPAITNVREEADVLRMVVLGELAVAKAGQYEHDQGATELVASGTWPLVAYAAVGADRHYLVGFHLADSTWSTDASFPIFMSNVIDRARIAHHVGLSQMVVTGSAATLPAGRTKTVVTDPRGDAHELPEVAGTFAGATVAGFYSVERGEAKTEFCANLLSPAESDITPRMLKASGGVEVAGSEGVARTNRPLWPFLAVAALVVLMVEWYCYHRRVLS